MISRPVLLLLLLLGCQAAPPPKEFDGAAALGYVKRQLDFGPRIPGSPGHAQMAAWLDSLLKTRADTVVIQAWTHTTKAGTELPLQNIIARFNPQAPRRLLFLAHWDTRPFADSDTGANAKQPVAGANDGASGVAVLLGMADALKKSPPAAGIGVDLMMVDGEDYGVFSEEVDVLIGSRYYAAHQLPGPKPDFAVLLDMVGDRDLNIYQEGYSLTAAPDVVDKVWSTAARLGYSKYFVAKDRHTLTDDHVPLQKAGIRAIDVIDFDYPDANNGNAYHHTVLDTIDKVSAESLKIVGDVMIAVIRTTT